jgi:hypothetical protein
MSRAQITGWLVRLYPAAWRARYGDEFAALLEQMPLTLPVIWDVLCGAGEERWNGFLAVVRHAFVRWQHQGVVLLIVLSMLYLPAPRPGRRSTRESLAPPLVPRFLFP